MPLYTYKCKDCANLTEASHSIKDDPEIACEVCQGPTKRVIQPAAFHLKGDSWFRHGYDTNHRKQ